MDCLSQSNNQIQRYFRGRHTKTPAHNDAILLGCCYSDSSCWNDGRVDKSYSQVPVNFPVSYCPFLLHLNSIHPFSIPASWSQRAYPSYHLARGRTRPGQVASPSQGHTETNETHNHSQLTWCVCLPWVPWVPWENPHIHGENMQTSHRKDPETSHS